MPMLTTINRAVYTPAMTVDRPAVSRRVDRPAVSRRADILAAAALLFASMLSGSSLSVLLLSLAPLPIILAAVGWSHWLGLAAAVLAAGVLGPWFGPWFAVAFLIGQLMAWRELVADIPAGP